MPNWPAGAINCGIRVDRLLIVRGRRRPAPQAIERVGQRRRRTRPRAGCGQSLRPPVCQNAFRARSARRRRSTHTPRPVGPGLFAVWIQLQRVGQHDDACRGSKLARWMSAFKCMAASDCGLISSARSADDLRCAELEGVERQLAQRRVHLGRVGIERQRRLEFLRRRRPGCTFRHTGGPPRNGPANRFRIGREQIGIELVDQKAELVAQPVPAGKLRGSQADPSQAFAIRTGVLVVCVNQPPIGVVGFGQFSRGGHHFGVHPMRKRLIRIELERRGHLLGGQRIVSPQTCQPR